MSSSVAIRPFGKNTAAADSVVVTDADGRLRASSTLAWAEATAAMTITGTLTVGEDDTGHDVKFFGATSGAYFEYDESADRVNVVTAAARVISGEEHAVDINMNGTLSSGDSMVGLNVAVTPTGTAGMWVSAIFAKVTQGTTKHVNGYLCAAELELNITGTYNPSDWAVLVLNSGDNNTGGQVHSSYILFRDYGTSEPEQVFRFYDASVGTTNGTSLFSSASAGWEDNCTHTMRIMVGTTPYWILLSNVTTA